MRVELGKITKASFGAGGYDDAMTGVSFTLGGESWGVSDFWGTWSTHNARCQWTVDEQLRIWGETVARLRDLLAAAKVKSVADLVGKPVEVTFNGNVLASWRILTEVL